MPSQIKQIIDNIAALEADLEQALNESKNDFGFTIQKKKVRFQKGAIKTQKKFKRLLVTYVFNARLLVFLTSPIIYALVVPLAFLDLSVSIYQTVCFPVYKVRKVRRRDYIVFDRHKLGYLNALEKLNCLYCGYGNGVLAYASEISARTESYWCPIKHARKTLTRHKYYQNFSEYGDAKNYAADLARNMEAVKKVDAAGKNQ